MPRHPVKSVITLSIAAASVITVLALMAFLTAKAITSFAPRKHAMPEEDDIRAVHHAAIYERTPENVQFFHSTNTDSTGPFRDIFLSPTNTNTDPHTTIHLSSYIRNAFIYAIANNPLLHLTALVVKFYYNRKRPYQQYPHLIKPLSTSTTRLTPSYPSTHALQAYAIAKHLSIIYPEKADIISTTAERVAHARVVGGVHYPSDKEFAKHLVHALPWL